MRALNEESLRLIRQWEGLVLYAYDDADPARPRRRIMSGDPVRGTLTIGYGHTRGVQPGQEITEAEAEALLRQDLAEPILAVERLVRIPLTPNQFGALVSLVLNIGVPAFRGSTLLQRLKEGDLAAVPGELARWNKTTVDGKRVVSEGLANRRAAEAGLWVRGSHVASNTVAAAEPAAPDRGGDSITVASAASAAAVVAPAIQALGGLSPWLAALIVVAVAAVAAVAVIARRRRQEARSGA